MQTYIHAGGGDQSKYREGIGEQKSDHFSFNILEFLFFNCWNIAERIRKLKDICEPSRT
jgi:hypothetical protein